MQTVRSVEREIQAYQEQEGRVKTLIWNIRAEPSWQPSGLRDARSEESRTRHEQNFQEFARNAATMQDVIAWFRSHSAAMRPETSEQDRARLEQISTQVGDILPLLEGLTAQLLTMLNAFREQRGAPIYQLTPGRAAQA